MDRRLAELIVAQVALPRGGPDPDGVALTADLDGRAVDVVCAPDSAVASVTLAPADGEVADADLAWAWLAATWLRRLDDGVVAAADDEGRLAFGIVLPRDGLSVDRAEQALAALDRAAQPGVPAPAEEGFGSDPDYLWIRA